LTVVGEVEEGDEVEDDEEEDENEDEKVKDFNAFKNLSVMEMIDKSIHDEREPSSRERELRSKRIDSRKETDLRRY
jgi:hypothetical protein